MTLDGIMLKGIFEHERLKPTIIRTSCGNVQNVTELKVMNTVKIKLILIIFCVIHDKISKNI